jgi:succinate dehydrogenase hydrophobic anchor subunit
MKALKWGSLVLLAVMLIACIGVVFSTDNASYKALSDNISQKCSS